jgi:tetratricopeptide (TPR) repeat protein
MIKPGSRFGKLLIASIALVLVAVTIAATYLYRVEQEKKVAGALLLMDQGITQFKQKQYETALETLRSIPQSVVEDWRIPYYTGATLVKLKDYESAAVSLEEALILNGKEKDIPFALGVVYFKLGNLSLSKSYFHSVLEIDPGHEEAKGLMDIMAKLERQQPDKSAADSKSKNTGVTAIGSQPGADLTSPSGTAETTGN